MCRETKRRETSYCEQARQAVNGTPEAQVSTIATFNPSSAHLALDSIQVQQGLGGVFARAVTRVDNRHLHVFCGCGGGTNLVAQNDDIAVLLEGNHTVNQRSPFGDG